MQPTPESEHEASEAASTRGAIEALRPLAEIARQLTGARYGVIGVARGDGKGVCDLVTAGFAPAEQAAMEASPREYSRADEVLRSLLEADAPLRFRLPREGEGQSEDFLGVALRRGVLVLGALYVTGKIDGAFCALDEDNLQSLANHATFSVHNGHALARERTLVAGMLEAQEEGRRALSSDLHDGLTKYVMAAHLHLEAFFYAQENGGNEKAAREIARVAAHLQKAVGESRRLINDLTSFELLQGAGLGTALELLLGEERARAGWKSVEFGCNIGGQRFEEILETTVYRIAQEALANARKHAHAQSVKVLCSRERDAASGRLQLRLEVQDDGVGFDSAARAQVFGAQEGIGLMGIAERTRMLGGSFDAHSIPGDGASVRAVFPLLETGGSRNGDNTR